MGLNSKQVIRSRHCDNLEAKQNRPCRIKPAGKAVFMATSPWNRMLDSPGEDHLVQFYGTDDDSLAVNVTKYLVEGLKRGEGAIVIATPAHIALFSRNLHDAGPRIAWLGANQTLAEFMVDGMPDWDRFQQTISPAIQSIRGHAAGLRAYGEMVGLLWTAGKYAAAVRLEQFWNRLLSRSPFTLFCGYPIDILSRDFDPDALDPLLCSHTHVVPAGDPRLEASIYQAMEQVLGSKAESAEAAMKDQCFRARWAVLPRSEALILWIRRNLPVEADEILARARSYSQAAAV
jgi:hypothetical protein